MNLHPSIPRCGGVKYVLNNRAAFMRGGSHARAENRTVRATRRLAVRQVARPGEPIVQWMTPPQG
jgi:hypothetical protein